MVLATIIRLEMAYPGVGILAGDSAQYLSIVTAHGVIMVFFMAMPLLFGFLGNFLLPTQMGVHDVAFPRMNSAAFWFLPASLLALCQLVCIDRRYQRMNCFNIRELQSLLRNRFFDELLPINVLNTSTSSSKDAIFNLNFILNRGSNVDTVAPSTSFNLNYVSSSTSLNPSVVSANPILNTNLAAFFSQSRLNPSFFHLPTLALVNLNLLVLTIANLFSSILHLLSFTLVKTTLSSLKTFFLSSPSFFFNLNNSSFISIINFKFNQPTVRSSESFANTKLNSTNPFINSLNLEQFGLFESFNTNFRNTSMYSPNIVYKIKIGNYLPDDLYRNNFNFLQTTFNFKNMFSSSPDWFNSLSAMQSVFKLGYSNDSVLDSSFLNQKLNFFNFTLNTEFLSQSKSSALTGLVNLNANSLLILKNSLISETYTLPVLFFSQAKQVRVLNN